MDPTRNPFAPGAGIRPPELAGRDAIIEAARLSLRRMRTGRTARGQFLLGLRGVGKTVLLDRLSELAEEDSYLTVALEASEDRRLAELLVPALRSLLFRLTRADRAKQPATRALSVLRAFASTFKVKVGDLDAGDRPEPGTADSGDLAVDLPELLLGVTQAVNADKKAIALFIDELHHLSPEGLGALVLSARQMRRRALPFIIFGAGLPQSSPLTGEARTYAGRLFEHHRLGPLDAEAAAHAIRAPLRAEKVTIEDRALADIVEKSARHPYFLQEWASQAWTVARKSRITAADVRRASTRALAALDADFFSVAVDGLTSRERDYLRAMAELGAGPHRSGDIAHALHMSVTTAAPLRSGLIRGGLIYSPVYGSTAFTSPMFDAFLQRTMPDPERPAEAKPGRRKR